MDVHRGSKEEDRRLISREGIFCPSGQADSENIGADLKRVLVSLGSSHRQFA